MSNDIFQSKEFKANLRKYEEAKASNSSVYLEPEDFSDIAEYYHLHGRLAEALEAVDLALQIFPGATDPLAFRARIAILVEHNASEAMRYVSMITDKNDLEYYYITAEIIIANGDTEKAMLYLEQQSKKVDDIDLEDFYLDAATLFADYDAYDIANEWLQRCEDTDFIDYQELKGRIELNLGHYKESIEIFTSLIDQDPYHTQYWNHLSSAHYFSNNLSESIECCDYALAINPEDHEALLNKANCLTMLGNFDQAMEYYHHYQRLQPMSEVADMGIAAVLMAQNEAKLSLEHWQRAEKLCQPHSSNAIDICRNLCIIYSSLNRFDDALQSIGKIEKISKGTTPDTLVLRGYISLSAERYSDAVDYFQKAYNMTPLSERDNTLFSIAYCYLDCGYMKEAHETLRTLAKSDYCNGYAELWAYLARTDYELGLKDEFMEDLKKSVEINPSVTKRELSDIFPKGMEATDFYEYAQHHQILKR